MNLEDQASERIAKLAYYVGQAILIGVLGLVITSGVVAQDKDPTEQQIVEDSFQIGGSCAALAYIDISAVKYLTNPDFQDDFHQFCYPEEPFECSDYTSFLRGYGQLETSGDGYQCSMQKTF